MKKVIDLCTTIPKIKNSYPVTTIGITGTVYSNILENIVFADVEGKIHFYNQTVG